MTILLRLMLRIAAILPLGINRQLGRWFGELGYVTSNRSALVTKTNLEICFPEKTGDEIKRLTRSSMAQTGMTAFETPAVWLRPRAHTFKWIKRVENEALLDTALAADQGTLLLLPHLGNWEMFNVYFHFKGAMTALYQPPRQDWLKPLMEKVRGDNLVATNRQGLSTLYKVLQSGGVVTVLPDQVPATGEFAPFFDRPALTDKLVPRLLAKAGANALMVTVYREKGGFVIRFDEVDDEIHSRNLDIALSALNKSIARVILPHIDQYQWEYKRFREQPKGYLKLYKYKGEEYYH